jgi:HSP20 family protein
MSKDLFRQVHSVFFPQQIAEQSGSWAPAVDIYRSRDGWLLKADLAGVDREDIAVEVKGHQLRIRGVRRDWCLEEGCHHYRMEIAYSCFERRIELPDDLDDSTIASEFRAGMLLIRITTRTSP